METKEEALALPTPEQIKEQAKKAKRALPCYSFAKPANLSNQFVALPDDSRDQSSMDYTGLYIGPKGPLPTYPPQRRGGFSLRLVRGDRIGCLRNSSATGCSRCPLSLFAGPAWRPALLRRAR